VEDVRQMQQEIIGMVREGAAFGELQQRYEQLMKRKRYPVMHSIGHGVGLDVHERPFVGDVLRENTVITVEPGIYLKGLGGCRLEDMVLVKKGRSVVLSA
jgi:Xaa-Pro dipeptidase